MKAKSKFPVWAIVLVVIAALVAVLGLSFIGPYNKMVNLDENVEEMQGNIQTQLQARFDKINELMPSVQGIMDHESDVYKDLAALRSNIPGTNMDANGNVTIKSNASIKDLESADAAGNQIIRDLNVVMENYPELKSDQNMSDFMISVEGIENRISVARKNYNSAVKEYNTYIRSFPHNLISGMFGFDKKDMFEASAQAQNAPQVKFNS